VTDIITVGYSAENGVWIATTSKYEFVACHGNTAHAAVEELEAVLREIEEDLREEAQTAR
jgi:predicted RNase H-like HicB family nuclease